MSVAKYDTVIGLEVHIQMNTDTKAFCGDGNVFGDDANAHVSAISLALPGTLPVANKRHIDKAILLGLALDGKIQQKHFFDRKHYSYPDLPKGYQITQDHQPIVVGGHVEIKTANGLKKIRIHHIHMEEDAGKSIHDQHDDYSLIDLNRAGAPLLELVTEPDLSSPEEVYTFISELQKLLKYLGVSDADMEKGALRCDCNVSVKPAGSTTLGERCEIKNLNSKRFAREAVKYEAQRQILMVEAGETFDKQTLQYDPVSNTTSIMREKEGIADYRYFPDPDMPPMFVTAEQIADIKKAMPELPSSLRQRIIEDYNMTEDYADQLTQQPEVYRYFEALAEGSSHKASANLLINQILPITSRDGIETGQLAITLPRAKSYLLLIDQDQVPASIAHQQLFPLMLKDTESSPIDLAKNANLLIEENEDELAQVIDQIIHDNPKQAAEYRKGKKALIGFFVGAVMRSGLKGIHPKSVKDVIIQRLES